MLCYIIYRIVIIVSKVLVRCSHNLSSCSLGSILLNLLVFQRNCTASDTQLLCLTYCSFKLTKVSSRCTTCVLVTTRCHIPGMYHNTRHNCLNCKQGFSRYCHITMSSLKSKNKKPRNPEGKSNSRPADKGTTLYVLSAGNDSKPALWLKALALHGAEMFGKVCLRLDGIEVPD